MIHLDEERVGALVGTGKIVGNIVRKAEADIPMTIQEFTTRLASVPEQDFTHEGILDFLRTHRVDPASLDPYLYFSREHYTRHLIHRTSLFELLAICWESGQKSAIHNHRDPSSWMATASGKVQV